MEEYSENGLFFNQAFPSKAAHEKALEVLKEVKAREEQADKITIRHPKLKKTWLVVTRERANELNENERRR